MPAWRYKEGSTTDSRRFAAFAILCAKAPANGIVFAHSSTAVGLTFKEDNRAAPPSWPLNNGRD